MFFQDYISRLPEDCAREIFKFLNLLVLVGLILADKLNYFVWSILNEYMKHIIFPSYRFRKFVFYGTTNSTSFAMFLKKTFRIPN